MSKSTTQNLSVKRKDNSVTTESNFFGILISTFSTIFVAELGDKTQIATLMLSAQSGRPGIVFIGAAIALIFSSLIGVLLGRWIANKLPREKFTFSAGVLMICLGLWLALQGFNGFVVFRGGL